MQGIPPVKDTDTEDVVWGLQTAASLWKRGERIDALIWLRRAAQAAGETNDDDRALELARSAAELTDWMANAPNTTVAPGVSDSTAPPTPNYAAATDSGAIDVSLDSAQSLPPATPAFPPPAPSRPQPPLSRPPSQPTMQTAEPTFDEDKTPMPSDGVDPSEGDRRSASVPPAEKVHAGIFNPWDPPASSQELPTASPHPPAPIAPAPSPLAPRVALSPSPAPPPPRFASEEEVVTSVRPHGLAEHVAMLRSNAPPPATQPPQAAQATPGRPPPLPPRAAQKPSPPRPPPPRPGQAPSPPKRPAPASATRIQAAPPSVAPPEQAPLEVVPPPLDPAPLAPAPPMTPVPPSPTQQMSPPDQERLRAASIPPGHPVKSDEDPTDERVPVAADSGIGDALAAAAKESFGSGSELPGPAVAIPDFTAPPPPSGLDLENIEAFADLPDDARLAFAAAATVSKLREGDEVSSFALAYVLEGAFDVAATMVDAPAVRIKDGAVLRAKGSTEEGVPMRLISAAPDGVVATWTDAAVEEAFRTCPWVEEDLRAAADRVQTLVGITIGPLGERLDVSIRESIVSQLQMRPLLAGEVVVVKGDPVPGLLLVGIGELELVEGETVKGTVSCGDFLFAGEVLHAGEAPLTARAGKGGALVLFGDRRIAQELLVTCPPLLEVFAGM